MKDIKGIKLGKEGDELYLSANGVILNLKDPTDSTRDLLDLINSSSIFAEYKTHKTQ